VYYGAVHETYTLVTGAAGFVGSRVSEMLLKENRKVIALDCFLPNLYSREAKIARWERLKSANLVKIEFDLRSDDFSVLSEYPIDSVINQAAMPGLIADWSNFAPYYDSNISGLNRLLEFIKKLNVKSFIQASTSSVYGKLAIGAESQELNPTSPYGVSKLAAEKLLLAYNDWFNIPVKILRYFSIYGPHQRPDMAYAKIISALYNNNEFTIFGDGEQRRSNTFIDDVVSATLLAEELAPSRSIINVCGDETVSLNQAILILEKHSGKRLKRVNAAGRTGDQQVTSGENYEAKKILGWQATTRIEEGLKLQLEAAANELTFH
jgi:nucleoside-diphosphate-sugar epimerase